jgi:hypothetical protein
MAVMISKHEIADEISEFLAEAEDARCLAATFDGGAAVADLLGYASTLEAEAAQLEERLCRRFAADVHDPKTMLARCGERAEKLRAIAEAMHDAKSREMFLQLAGEYDRMAESRVAIASSGHKRAG